MADIPGVVNGPVRVRYFQLLPFGGSSISADVMASFLKEILNRLEVITL